MLDASGADEYSTDMVDVIKGALALSILLLSEPASG
jgi:hypothetical protein